MKNLNKKTVMQNAWFNYRNNKGLTFAQCLKNAWTGIKIETLQLYVDGCKMMRAPFVMYQKEAFMINDLKKTIVRPVQVEVEEVDFVLDFAMFNLN